MRSLFAPCGPLRFVIACAALLVGAPALGQPRNDGDVLSSDGDPDTATVRGSRRGLERVAGAVTTLDRRDLERMQPQTPQEALRALPGLYIRDEDGVGLRFNISLRGLDPTRSRRMVLLEDGMPTSINPYAEPDAYYNAPVDRMDHLEVARGAGVVLFGPQTLGGVLNQVTPSPTLTPRWTLRVFGGTPRQVGGFARWSGPIGGPLSLVVSASHREGEGFRAMPFNVTDLWAKLRAALGRHQLTLRVNAYREDSHTTYLGLTRAQFVADPRTNLVPADEMQLQRHGAGLTWEFAAARDVRVRTLAYAYSTHRDWRRQLYDRTRIDGVDYERTAGQEPGGAIYFRPTFRSNDRQYSVVGVEPRVYVRARTGAVRHAIEVGARVLYERALPRVILDTQDPSVPRTLYADETREGLALAAVAQDELRVGRYVTVTPALRVERYAALRELRVTGGAPNVVDGSTSAWALIPALSVAVGNDALMGFVGFHRGWAPPRTSVAISGVGADAQLAAELSWNGELGVRTALGEWLRAEATAFLMDFENEIIPGSGAGAVTTEYINGGATRRFGVEAAAHVDLGRALARPWSLYADLRYTWVDARFTGGDFEGNVVPYAPPHTLRAALGFEVLKYGLGAQVGWSYTASHFADRANVAEESEDGRSGAIAAFQNLDLTVRYQHRGTGLGVALTARNLLDDVYVASRLPDGIFPGGFRTLMASLRWDTPGQ